MTDTSRDSAGGLPVLVIDVKGDLPNLLFGFPTFDPSVLVPWVDASHADVPIDEIAKRSAGSAVERATVSYASPSLAYHRRLPHSADAAHGVR
jgi:hypothetical protein